MIAVSPPELAGDGRQGDAPFVMTAHMPNDVETPVSAMLKLGRDAPDVFLLESVERGNYRGRYSIIGLEPDLIWRVEDGVAHIARGEDAVLGRFVVDDRPAMESLRALIAESALALPEGAPAPAAGLFGYLGYGMVRQIEPRVPKAKRGDPIGAADAILVRPQVVIIFDALRQDLTLYAPVRPTKTVALEAAAEAARARLLGVAERLASPAPSPQVRAPAAEAVEPRPTRKPETYRAAVTKAKEHIHAGDAFQIVPSQRLTAPFELPPFAFYRALRRLNPSPFLFYFNFQDMAVVGSSPEILVRVQDGVMTSRPIAGTRPRGQTTAEDAANEADLLADPKERAEHLMLVDLSRNDVGRVCEPGSVTVTESFVVERYSHVMHIVSNVTGKLKPECDALDAFMAGFPHGTVTGAPKVRAMEIIAALEGEERGVYAGGVGYISAGGDMDTCIALRTGVIKDGMLHVRAGAGVVYDSDPEAERLETLQKAAALFRAAGEARRFV